jgi:preprotein translocase subunit SecA
MNIAQAIFNLIFGTKQQRDVKRMRPIVEKVNAFEDEISALDNDKLHHKTVEFKERLSKGESLDDLMTESFAVVREVSKRTLQMRHFDVQIIGGVAMHNNAIAEMKTGEGKTLVATLPIYLNGLTEKGVHLITVNDYLARRDAQWMGPIYKFLDMSVGVINHEVSYRLEWDDISQYTVKLIECSRQEAYACDITYGTNNEFGFDYLRDNMAFSLKQKVQRGHYYAIVDEVDSILIDEARTPLIISGPSDEATDLYYKIDKIIPRLTRAELNEKNEIIEGTGDFGIFEKEKSAVLTEQGAEKVEKLLGINDLFSPQNSRIVHHITQGIRAHHLFVQNVAYVVENGEVIIVDEFTGRKMPGRRWSDGLHQAIEAKERLSIKKEFQTLATVTFQNYFRMYDKLAGMTGTAETEATEFYSIYKLDVVSIPTNVLVVRADYSDKIFINERAKFNHIVEDVAELYKKGQPVLLGTVSVEKSEVLSKLLTRKHVRHNVLNAKYHESEADIVMRAGQRGAVTIATNMAGRGTDIKLGEGVVGLGGLAVIGSERHEARRIDNQLRGRSGRQGDPGMSQFYVSLEDDLMRLFGMNNRINMMKSMGFSEDEEIQSKMISNAIERAQKRVETRNFEIRKNLLEYDDVMNEQRLYIYSIRDKILDISNNFGLIDELISDIIENFLSSHFEDKLRKPDFWSKDDIRIWFKANFYRDVELDFSHMDYDEAFNIFHKTIKDIVWAKFERIPDEIKAEGFKYVVLRVLDDKWKEHLRNIDALQEGIGLLGYAQKNPIVEYKREAYDMFIIMSAKFKLEALSLLSRLQIKASFEPAPEEYESTPSHTRAIHNEYGQFDSMNAGARTDATNKPSQGKPEPIRKQKKIGRNDPCWCGSGKKYKYCHMDEDERKSRANFAQQ